jgi:hypothetical protein
MKKIINIAGQLLGTKKGLLSVIAEKGVGKISFKRVGSTMVIAWIVNKVEPSELTLTHAVIIGLCLISVALPKLFTKD